MTARVHCVAAALACATVVWPLNRAAAVLAAQTATVDGYEYVRGEIYANVWHTDRIARISPQSGRVTGWIDLRGLMSTVYRLDPEAVLNGIAHDAASNRLFVTGKLWPRLFEIEIVPRR
jgi:glutamine cyclotransferase